MESPQSHVFGFPNMIIGDMAYPVLITVALAAIVGTKFRRGFLVAMNIGILLGALFAYFLFFSSLYVIQVLCPWCLVVTFSTTLILAAMTHINMRANAFKLKKSVDKRVQKFISGGYGKLIVFFWIILLIVLVFVKFGVQAIFA